MKLMAQDRIMEIAAAVIVALSLGLCVYLLYL